MFKKLYKKIADLTLDIKSYYNALKMEHEYTRSVLSTNTTNILSEFNKIKKLESTIESQQRTIEQLTNALKDKYEHGLFIFSEDCKIPTVIRNGKELTNKLTSYFSIDWEVGSAPNITIEQFAGTSHDIKE